MGFWLSGTSQLKAVLRAVVGRNALEPGVAGLKGVSLEFIV